ncbi:MAG: hypothetical protein ABI026_07100, partial [Gemmatimonadaceae bacterium]
MRKRSVAAISAGAIVLLIVIAGAALLVLTQSSWGRKHVQNYLVGVIRDATHGYLSVDRIDGNLLTGATIVGVTITDSAHAPFVTVDTIHARYAIRDFIDKRIYLDDVTLVHPIIVLNRVPGGKWNWDRIYPRDTTQAPSAPGFLSWITLRNVTVVDGRITASSPWAPDSMLSTTQKDSVIRVATSDIGRLNLKRVPGGFQKTSDFRNIYGTFPLMRLEDPEDKRQIIDVSALRMTAEPLKPPSVRVTDVKGRFTVLADSLYFSNVAASLASSKLSRITGRYNIDSNDLRLRLHGDTIATNDMLWIDPSIPEDGHGRMDFALDWVGKTSDYAATNASLTVAGAAMTGKLGVLVNDTLAFHDTDIQVKRLDTRTIQQLFPTIKSPRQGYLTGHMAATGGFGALKLDADVTFDDHISGTSHVLAQGIVGADKGIVRARDLHVTLAPLRVALARSMDPSLPIGGTLTGKVVLDGSTATRLNARADLVHNDVTGRSHATGTIVFASRGRVPLVNANLQLLPLSLATAGKFAPAAGLHGSVTGPVSATGPMSNLVVDANLTTPDGGSITAHGTVGLETKPQPYDFGLTAHLFDASQISTKAPSTSFTAELAARGTGFDPATLTTTATAKIKPSVYDSVSVDSALIRLAAADGMLTIDTLAVDVPNGYASAAGQFGLVRGRSGKLQYTVTIDSLSALQRVLPQADTGAVHPRPAILAERISRADSARAQAARATMVERAVTGKPLPAFPVDTPRVIPRRELRGSVAAHGTATGNIHTFDMTGSATAQNIIAFGNSVRGVSANYAWTSALTPESRLSAEASAVNVLAMGFALDTVSLTTAYTHPSGTLRLSIHQDSNRVYNATAAYVLNKDQDDIRLDSLQLRFDSTLYSSTGPSTIHFGTAGTSIDHFEVTTKSGSRVFLNGTLPATGDADLKLSVTQFDVGNIVALLQSDINAHGLVSVEAHMQGTSAAPRLTSVFGIERFYYMGHATPEVHGKLSYADQTLHATANAAPEGKAPVITAQGDIPINLALSGVTGSRVPRDRAIAATVTADSLPLNLIPQVSDVVSDLTGRARAKFTVAGTINHPDVEGTVALWNGSGRIVPLGLMVNGVATNIRLLGDTVVIDSLVARSNGVIRVTGGIGLKNLAKPSFAIRVAAR